MQTNARLHIQAALLPQGDGPLGKCVQQLRPAGAYRCKGLCQGCRWGAGKAGGRQGLLCHMQSKCVSTGIWKAGCSIGRHNG